jgi:hypothetical protein
MSYSTIRHRYARKLAAAALIGLSLAACDSATTPVDPDSDDRPATIAAFEQARGRWSSLGLSDYDYVFSRSCFCAPDFREPVRITVRGGQVAAVTSVATGQPRPTEGYPTVDDLFATLQEALDGDAALVRVTYDPALAYPTSFYIDRDFHIADEEYAVEATELSAH